MATLSFTSSSSSPAALLFNNHATPFHLPPISYKLPRLALLHVKCLSNTPDKDSILEDEIEDKSSLSISVASSSISTYNWCAGLGGLGFLETTYLTFLKFTDSDVFCPVGSSSTSCNTILNSHYSLLFGVPLPLIGMIAYGLVTFLALKLAGKELPFRIDETNSRLILLATTTSMATASTYFLYVLSTSFPGDSCAYCLFSALLSFGLLFSTLKASGLQGLQNNVGVQLVLAALVVSALSTSYSISAPVSTSMANTNMPFFATEITTQSSPFTLSLARHLQSIGAKMYGAFWCSHCVEQKQMFGSEAAKLLNYTECFPDGYRTGVKIDKACANVGIEGFPTWVINGFEWRTGAIRACSDIWI
ncbi:thiol-disulfide oxidoreductase LTO1 isoform X2 [Apium graveolens]|uniref:thiol-disulfide oxidoreductase LTO1 isoform X2 n=1 Tax=Apium graveolens TaxID=4045 RepID=UPI003D7BD026